jgi:hypothetical protein
MAKINCLKVPAAIKTITLRNVRPIRKDTKPSSSPEDITFIDLAGNCFTSKPQTGIIIGGYVICEVEANLPDEPQIRY